MFFVSSHHVPPKTMKWRLDAPDLSALNASALGTYPSWFCANHLNVESFCTASRVRTPFSILSGPSIFTSYWDWLKATRPVNAKDTRKRIFFIGSKINLNV